MTTTRQGIEVSIAVADAVKMAKAEVVAAYPITPQTHIVEHLAEFPELGRPGLRPGTRSLTIPPYVITYRVRPDRLEILSVWHGRRQPAP